MTSSFLWNAAFLLALMAVAAVIEVFIPLFTRGESSKERITPNLSLTAVNLGVNWLLTAVTAIVALDLKPPALLSALPFAIQVLVTVMLLDFMYGYVSHVLLHKIPMLWQFHRVHHSDAFVDDTRMGTWAASGRNSHLPAVFESQRRSGARQYSGLAPTRPNRFSRLVHAERAQGASFQRAGGNRHQLWKYLFHL